MLFMSTDLPAIFWIQSTHTLFPQESHLWSTFLAPLKPNLYELLEKSLQMVGLLG